MAQQPQDDLRVDIAWYERYTSASLNQKFAGVIPVGVYKGFDVKPGSGLNVIVGSDTDDNMAVVERNNYSLTARMPQDKARTVPVQAGRTNYVVIEAFYAEHSPTTVEIKTVTTLQSYHVLLATIILDAGATSVADADISYSNRVNGSFGRPSDMARYAVPRPDFHLPLVSDIHIREGGGTVEFSRASGAYETNKLGQLVWRNIDEPRLEKSGLFIEGPGTNLLIHSEDLDEANKYHTDLRLNIHPIRSGQPRPLSNELAWSDKSNAAYCRFGIGGEATEGVVTASIFIKPQAGTHVWLGVVARDGSRYVLGSRLVNLKTGDDDFSCVPFYGGMYRVSVTWDCGSGNASNLHSAGLEISFRDGGGPVNTPIYVGGWQLEENHFATSYISTLDTPLTRAGEYLDIDGSRMKPSGYTMSYSLSVNNNMKGISGYYEILSQETSGSTYFQRNLHRVEGGRYKHYVNAVGYGGEIQKHEKTKIVVSLEAGATETVTKEHKVYMRGIQVHRKPETIQREGDYNPVYRFGGGMGSNASFHIQDLKLWGHVLSGEQAAGLGVE